MTSRTNRHVPVYTAWRPDPKAIAVDAFTVSWHSLDFWVFSTFQHYSQSSAKDPGGYSNRTSLATTLAHTAVLSCNDATADQPPKNRNLSASRAVPSRSTRRSAPITRAVATPGLPHVRRTLKNCGLYDRTANIVMISWRPTTKKQYGPCLRQWEDFCTTREVSPSDPPLPSVLELLTDFVETGVGYSSINTARSAFGTIITLPHEHSLGSHPLVKQFMKGFFLHRPSLPCYTSTWDVSQALYYLRTQDNANLSLKLVAPKLTTLLCLVTGQCLQTLAALQLDHVDLRCQAFDPLFRPDLGLAASESQSLAH